MVSSTLILGDKKIHWTMVYINRKDSSMKISEIAFPLDKRAIENIKRTKRITIPAKIEDKRYSIPVPYTWNGDLIEEYAQSFMDELYLHHTKVMGSKTIEEIIKSFTLELLIMEDVEKWG